MQRKTWLNLLALSLPLLTGACDPMDVANGLGQYMPTIGDRCESTQCITSSGQMESDSVKAEKLRQQQAAQKAATPPSGATTAPAGTAAPAANSDPNDPYDTYKPF